MIGKTPQECLEVLYGVVKQSSMTYTDHAMAAQCYESVLDALKKEE